MPRTEAGMRLLARLYGGPSTVAAIEAIEAEASIPDRDALARALPGVMSQEVTDQVYEPGTDPLDCPDEWFMTPRELADAIIAVLKEQP